MIEDPGTGRAEEFSVNQTKNVTRPKRAWLLIGGILLGLLLGGVIDFLFVEAATGARAEIRDRILAFMTGRPTKIDTSSVAVVEQVRKLSRLETVVYSIDKVVEGQRENVLLPDFLAGEKLLLVAHGEVTAGIDLSQLKNGDVTVSGDAVRVHLPAAQVLSTRLDNEHTRVYSRSTGLLVAADPNLESVVRQAAEQQVTKAAMADGILEKAHTNAQAAVTTLLYGLGFHSVTVN
jgi:transposase